MIGEIRSFGTALNGMRYYGEPDSGRRKTHHIIGSFFRAAQYMKTCQ